MADGEMPDGARHPMAGPEAPMMADDNLTGEPLELHLKQIAHRVNRQMSMDLSETDFPEEKGDRESNPRGLPNFWGLTNKNFIPENIDTIHAKCRKASLLLHPDKHRMHGPELTQRMGESFQRLRHIYEETCAYLDDMARRFVRCPNDQIGLCAFQELPHHLPNMA